jgi:hypothetical protein
LLTTNIGGQWWNYMKILLTDLRVDWRYSIHIVARFVDGRLYTMHEGDYAVMPGIAGIQGRDGPWPRRYFGTVRINVREGLRHPNGMPRTIVGQLGIDSSQSVEPTPEIEGVTILSDIQSRDPCRGIAPDGPHMDVSRFIAAVAYLYVNIGSG